MLCPHFLTGRTTTNKIRVPEKKLGIDRRVLFVRRVYNILEREREGKMFTQTSNPLCSLWRESKRRVTLLYHLLGFRFLAIVVLVEHILQAFLAGGGASGLIGTPIMLILSRSGLPATRIQIFETIAISAWQLKPLIGILSDTLYLGGYNKTPLIIFTSVVGVMSAALLVALYPLTPHLFTLLVFFIFLQIATSDLLLEARYVEKTIRSAESRPMLHSFIQFGSCFWQFLSIILMGVAIRYHMPLEWLYLTPITPFILLIVLLFCGWLGEKPRDDDEHEIVNLLVRFCWYRERQYGSYSRDRPLLGLDVAKVREHWRIFALALLIGSISLMTSSLGLLELGTGYLFGASLGSAVVMIGAFFLLLDRQIAKIQTFVVIQNVFSISLRAATFFFYTDPVEAYPAGPHFSREFYVSVMGAVGIVLALVGVMTYATFMMHWSYRRVFAVTGIFYMLALLPNIALYRRWNIALGIPDIVFVLGAEVVQTIVGVWNNMPFGVLMLSLCPPGMEASIYAILAGTSNLGSAFAAYQGAFVLDMLHIKPTGNMSGEAEQFDNLWIASAINISMQIVPLCFIPFLLPDARQTDNLLPEPKASMTTSIQHDISALETSSEEEEIEDL